ncbi:MAG: pyridoxamine 5'-phosphate oxidase family protein [Halobacteriaceae archaeon]
MANSISQEAIERIKSHSGVAHVATSKNDDPHVAPLFYCYENESMYFITGGKKLENILANPRVAISLYEQVGDHPEDVRQATILGTATVIDEDWDRIKEYGDRIRTKYYGKTSEEWPTRSSTLVRVDIGSIAP